ncbi:hypothetical protein AB751O23_AD_00030 [Chlamydiales bacterium SCGC AB-751-O23]|jgi:hypothetical protein|nr:hypothetical protein AB751O23_AD_00030 [Chlamydiales bacterium SCGC AB-751-O23]
MFFFKSKDTEKEKKMSTRTTLVTDRYTTRTPAYRTSRNIGTEPSSSAVDLQYRASFATASLFEKLGEGLLQAFGSDTAALIVCKMRNSICGEPPPPEQNQDHYQFSVAKRGFFLGAAGILISVTAMKGIAMSSTALLTKLFGGAFFCQALFSPADRLGSIIQPNYPSLACNLVSAGNALYSEVSPSFGSLMYLAAFSSGVAFTTYSTKKMLYFYLKKELPLGMHAVSPLSPSDLIYIDRLQEVETIRAGIAHKALTTALVLSKKMPTSGDDAQDEQIRKALFKSAQNAIEEERRRALNLPLSAGPVTSPAGAPLSRPATHRSKEPLNNLGSITNFAFRLPALQALLTARKFFVRCIKPEAKIAVTALAPVIAGVAAAPIAALAMAIIQDPNLYQPSKEDKKALQRIAKSIEKNGVQSRDIEDLTERVSKEFMSDQARTLLEWRKRAFQYLSQFDKVLRKYLPISKLEEKYPAICINNWQKLAGASAITAVAQFIIRDISTYRGKREYLKYSSLSMISYLPRWGIFLLPYTFYLARFLSIHLKEGIKQLEEKIPNSPPPSPMRGEEDDFDNEETIADAFERALRQSEIDISPGLPSEEEDLDSEGGRSSNSEDDSANGDPLRAFRPPERRVPPEDDLRTPYFNDSSSDDDTPPLSQPCAQQSLRTRQRRDNSARFHEWKKQARKISSNSS